MTVSVFRLSLVKEHPQVVRMNTRNNASNPDRISSVKGIFKVDVYKTSIRVAPRDINLSSLAMFSQRREVFCVKEAICGALGKTENKIIK